MTRIRIIWLFMLLLSLWGGYACKPVGGETNREDLYTLLGKADSCSQHKEEERAIQYYFEWLEQSEGKVSSLSRAEVYDKIGTLYLYRYLYLDAIDMFRRSASIFREMGDWKEEALAWRNIGRANLMRHRSDSIIPFYQRAIRLAEDTGEQDLLKEIQQEFQFVCSKIALLRGNTHLWLHYLDRLDQMDASCLLLGSIMVSHPDNYDEAERWLLKAADSEDIYIRTNAYRKLYDWSKKVGDAEKTARYSDFYIQLADSLEKDYSISLAFRDLGQSYERQRMEVEHERLKNQQLRRTILLLLLMMGLCLMLLIGVFLYHREKQKRKRELAHLIQQIREKEQIIEDLQISLPAPSSKYQTFDLLYRLKSEPRYGLIKTEDEWFQLYAVINRLYGDIVGKLEGCPQLTEQDVRVCYLLHARMSNATLGLLFNVDSRSVVKSKQRIKKKMGIAADLTLEEYLDR